MKSHVELSTKFEQVKASSTKVRFVPEPALQEGHDCDPRNCQTRELFGFTQRETFIVSPEGSKTVMLNVRLTPQPSTPTFTRGSFSSGTAASLRELTEVFEAF